MYQIFEELKLESFEGVRKAEPLFLPAHPWISYVGTGIAGFWSNYRLACDMAIDRRNRLDLCNLRIVHATSKEVYEVEPKPLYTGRTATQ